MKGARIIACCLLFDGKIHVCIEYKIYAAEKINESTSFTIDNMYYINFKIQE